MSPPCARRASATRPSARTNGVTCDRRRRDGPVPERARDALSEVRTSTRFSGKVATGFARLGVRAAIVSRVGADGHGDYVRAWLAREGIDVRFLATDPYWPTPPTLVAAVRRGTVAGAIVASRLACSEAMPRLDELEAALV